MIIKSIGREYFVIAKLSENNELTTYITRINSEADGQFYTVIQFSDSELIKRVTPYFIKLKDNDHFTDYVDCFASQGSFYAVFVYYYQNESMYFSNKIAKMSMTERNAAVRNLLAKLFMQDIPVQVLADILRPEAILIKSNYEIFFNYFLQSFDDYHDESLYKPMILLAYLLRLIYEKEISDCSVMRSFISGLETRQFANFQNIYKAYMEIYDKLNEYAERFAANKKKSIWTRLKEWFGVTVTRLRPVLAVLIIAVGIAYIVYSAFQPPAIPVDSGLHIEQIGTVRITD